MQSAAFDEVRETAAARDLVALRTPGGIGFAPAHEGEVIEREAFMALPEEERKAAEERIQSMQQEVQKVLRGMPARIREHRAKVRELNREMTRFAVGPLFAELEERYAGEEDVGAYLEAAENDVVEHARELLQRGSQGESDSDGEEDLRQALAGLGAAGGGGEASLRRYARQRRRRPRRRRGGADRPRGPPDPRQPARPRRVPAAHGRPDHRLLADQGRRPASRQRRLPGARGREAAAPALRLGRAQAGADRRRGAHRVAGAGDGPAEHGDARAGADAARRSRWC